MFRSIIPDCTATLVREQLRPIVHAPGPPSRCGRDETVIGLKLNGRVARRRR